MNFPTWRPKTDVENPRMFTEVMSTKWGGCRDIDEASRKNYRRRFEGLAITFYGRRCTIVGWSGGVDTMTLHLIDGWIMKCDTSVSPPGLCGAMAASVADKEGVKTFWISEIEMANNQKGVAFFASGDDGARQMRACPFCGADIRLRVE